jgi:RsiW-degrading membrane proteinase PrsW (M82 family)
MFELSALAALLPVALFAVGARFVPSFENMRARDSLLASVVGALGGGVVASIGAAWLGAALALFIFDQGELFKSEIFFVSPIAEEVAKSAFIAALILFGKKRSAVSGTLVGAAAGVGFAAVENFLYYVFQTSTLDSWLELVAIRSTLTVGMHALCGAAFGSFLSFARRQETAARLFFPALGLFVAFLIHFAWNYGVGAGSKLGVGVVFFLMVIVLFRQLWVVSLKHDRRAILEETAAFAEAGAIPDTYPPRIAAVKPTRGWIDEGVRMEYRRLAIDAAFLRKLSGTASAKRAEKLDALVKEKLDRLAELRDGANE